MTVRAHLLGGSWFPRDEAYVPVNGTCGAHELDPDAQVDLHMHFIAVPIMIGISLIGATLPLVADAFFNIPIHRLVPFQVIKLFGAGVVLATSIVHKFTPSQKQLANSCFEVFSDHLDIFSGTAALTGILLTHLLHLMASNTLNRIMRKASAIGRSRSLDRPDDAKRRLSVSRDGLLESAKHAGVSAGMGSFSQSECHEQAAHEHGRGDAGAAGSLGSLSGSVPEIRVEAHLIGNGNDRGDDAEEGIFADAAGAGEQQVDPSVPDSGESDDGKDDWDRQANLIGDTLAASSPGGDSPDSSQESPTKAIPSDRPEVPIVVNVQPADLADSGVYGTFNNGIVGQNKAPMPSLAPRTAYRTGDIVNSWSPMAQSNASLRGGYITSLRDTSGFVGTSLNSLSLNIHARSNADLSQHDESGGRSPNSPHSPHSHRTHLGVHDPSPRGAQHAGLHSPGSGKPHGEPAHEEHTHTPGELIYLKHKQLRVYIIEILISIHSIIFGASLGASSEKFKILLIALAFHQFNEGQALSRLLIRGRFKNMRLAVVTVAAYSLVIPCGILLGIASNKWFLAQSWEAVIVESTLGACSSGMLLYDVLVNIIAPHFHSAQFMHASSFTQAWQVMTMWAGVYVMSMMGQLVQ
ncbi:hypothetical protein HK105_200842 [Polyrhizophydium stewartii]|uniref:Uncharacterized protein n=1 Tax=Polyrhizophydium stewartii TaxID=2732419 RepID=A0ABR4NK62_9FUNG|nr:hypothetical protein HK105_000109 [Polyrhizophydium stewartii]